VTTTLPAPARPQALSPALHRRRRLLYRFDGRPEMGQDSINDPATVGGRNPRGTPRPAAGRLLERAGLRGAAQSA